MASQHPDHPRNYDAVLGGQAPPQAGGVVLGGIEGVKVRLATAAVEQRVAALSEALKYGEAGLDLVLQGLRDESKRVQFATYSLLKERQEPKVKQQLRNYLPWFEFDVVTVDALGREINTYVNQAQFFEEDLGNGVNLTMVSIPGGTFCMGSPEIEDGRRNTESPQHWVTIAPLFMGKYPVTQAQWQAVAALPKVNCSLNPDRSFFKGANRPVEQVSWHEAVEFCARLSKKTGRSYRLPSEAQWEYAARAGTTTPFHFGETITPHLANYNGNYSYLSGRKRKGTHRQQTTDVGIFPANAFGLYDLHGLVWEFCADPWHRSYDLAPSDGRVWNYDIDNYYQILRGGSWNSNPRNCRSASRNCSNPGSRIYDIGFRVVCTGMWNS